jgi:hypothetical protein
MYDQFNNLLSGMSVNEQFSNINEVEPQWGWSFPPNGTQNAAGKVTFTDEYCETNSPAMPPPQQGQPSTREIDSATQTYSLGSATVGQGVPVQTQTLTRYVDHPTVTNIVSPVQ